MDKQKNRIVTKIDANPILANHGRGNRLLKVAAYCRVSTDSEDQLESYKAQVAYYTDAIAKNPKWRFVDIYADEGITGTLATKRENFLRMIRDCDKGKIDLIITKSVARFARNTVDSLRYVRKLKAKGIGVYFEEQCLDSLKADSEMFIGIHSVLAQAESENISANVRWGIQQRMRSGTYKFRYNLLGYVCGENGEPEIEPQGAETVRLIYRRFLNGDSLDQIKYYLETHHIETYTGKEVWSKTIIKNILTNERYVGDMLLQKTFTENPITKKVKKNRGEMAKYLITNNHPAIIDRDTYRLAQMEFAKRSSKRKTSDNAITERGKHSGKYALSELLICGECGSPYRRKTWTRNGDKRIVWRCFSRMEHGTLYCKQSISVDEGKLQNAICRGLKKYLSGNEEAYQLILSNLAYGITGEDETLDIYAIEKKIKELQERIEENAEMASRTGGDKSRFEEIIIGLSSQIMALKNQLKLVKEKLSSNDTVSLEIKRIKEIIEEENKPFEEYDDTIVRLLVEYIKVMPDGKLIIVLKGDVEIEEQI